MRVFLPTFLILVHLFSLSSPTVALDGSATDIGENYNVASGASDTPKANSWGSFLNPTHIIDSIKNLPSTLHITASKSSPADFWDMAQKYEKMLQDHVPRLLEDAAIFFKLALFTDVSSAMHDILNVTATFRDGIQGGLDPHHITLDALTEELEYAFMEIVHEVENIPAPDKAPSHAERAKMVDRVFDQVEFTLVNFTGRYGLDQEVVTTFIVSAKPQVHALTVTIGDINEQYPKLFPILAFCVATLLIPESWILRPLLSTFGFGPSGPIKGMAAPWLQRYFWGAAVKSGSWFSLLQAAGTGVFPSWAGLVAKVPLLIGGIWAILAFPCFGRRR